MITPDDLFDLPESEESDSSPPVFTATYAGECSEGDRIEPGDTIRADGEGGWAHVDCLELLK